MRLTRLLLIALSTLLLPSLLAPFASASRQEKKKSQSATPVRVSQTKLEVKELGGDFERWGFSRVLETPQALTFRWSTEEPGVASAVYQVTDAPRGFTGMTSETMVITGSAGAVPAKGHVSVFTINFATFVPRTPPKSPKQYYVRILPRNSANQLAGAPPSWVTITYLDNSHQATDFSGIPNQFKPRKPMPIETSLRTLTMNKPNEGEGSDDPYLFVAVVYLDGSTVKGWDLAHSSVRVQPLPAKPAHNNVLFYEPDNAPRNGKPYSIPVWTGSFRNEILPIDRLSDHPEIKKFPLEFRKAAAATSWDVTQVIVLVIALEEDGTTDGAVDKGRQVLLENLQSELNGVIRNLTLSQALQLAKDTDAFAKTLVEQLREKIKNRVIDAMKEATLKNWWTPWGLFDALDPDDFVGADHALISYRKLRDARGSGIPFTLNFNSKSNGSYTIQGSMRRVCKTAYCAGLADSLE